MSAPAVRSAFRSILRAHRAAFRGDLEMIATAQRTTRDEFDKAASEVTAGAGASVRERLAAAEETIDFLRHHVVQAPLNARGNYEVSAARIRTDAPAKA